MNIRKLSPELAEVAKKELNEDPDRIDEDLKILKEWLAKQPHLNARTDDQWLVAFLRGCKYSLERTKEKLDMYYTVRTASPEICLPYDPLHPKVQEYLNSGATVVLPKISKPGEPRVILGRPGLTNPDKFSIHESAKIHGMITMILLLEDDHTTVSGHRIIGDLSGMTMGHFAQMNPALAKKFVVMSQEAIPIRQKGSHYLNAPPGTETILNVFKQFMNEKNRNRLFIHNNDMEALYKYVPKSILPTEYGGDAGPIQDMIDDLKKKFESHRDFFLEELNYKSDESKRLGKPKTTESLYGIEGSFRQLSVD